MGCFIVTPITIILEVEYTLSCKYLRKILIFLYIFRHRIVS